MFIRAPLAQGRISRPNGHRRRSISGLPIRGSCGALANRSMTLIPRRALLLPLSLVLAAAALAADTGAVPLPERVLPGLGPILSDASRQSPRMLSRAIDLEIAENNRLAARSNILPSVGLNFRQVEARDDRADQPKTLSASKTYYDASITQPLFHWGERRNLARVGEIQQQIARGNHREAYRGLALEIRHRYLILIAQKRLVARGRDYVAYTAQQVRLAEERLAKKVISEMEFFPVRLAADQAQIGLERAEFDFASSRAAFGRLVGGAVPAPESIPDDIPELPYDAALFDRLLAGFLADDIPDSIEAVNLGLVRDIEDLNLRNQRTRLRPKVSLVAGANQDEQSYTLNTAQKYKLNSLYAGVTVSWTIFDGFAAQAAVRNSLARLRQLEIDRGELAHRLGQQAQTQAKQVYFSARAMAIADRAYVSAQGGLRARQADFARGAVSESDVALAGIQVHDTRIAAFNARTDFLLRVGEFLGTVGGDPVLAALDDVRR